jgi:hypothetical protein
VLVDDVWGFCVAGVTSTEEEIQHMEDCVGGGAGSGRVAAAAVAPVLLHSTSIAEAEDGQDAVPSGSRGDAAASLDWKQSSPGCLCVENSTFLGEGLPRN